MTPTDTKPNPMTWTYDTRSPMTQRALLKQVLAMRGAARSLAEQADALVECLAPEQPAPKEQTGPRYLGDDEPTEPEPEK